MLIGFFLPGDSLLFVAGIYSTELANEIVVMHNDVLNLLLLVILISTAGILGNYLGYSFGKKSGPFIFHRKDTFFLRKNIYTKHTIFMKSMAAKPLYLLAFYPSFEPLLLL